MAYRSCLPEQHSVSAARTLYRIYAMRGRARGSVNSSRMGALRGFREPRSLSPACLHFCPYLRTGAAFSAGHLAAGVMPSTTRLRSPALLYIVLLSNIISGWRGA